MIFFAALFSLGLSAASAAEARIAALAAFGDSLSDGGNGDGAPYTDGGGASAFPHASWVAQLADLTGTEPLIPARRGGANHAVGGAEAAALSEQVDAYLQARRGIVPPDTLCVLWAGGNDVINAATRLYTGGAGWLPEHDRELERTGARAAESMAREAGRLARAGARHVLWANLPGIDLTPRARGTGDTALRAGLRAASRSFNRTIDARFARLGKEFPKVRFVRVDTFGLFDAVAREPATFGFRDVEHAGAGGAGPPDTHMFWDDLHPSARMHRLIAEAARDALHEALKPPVKSASSGTVTATPPAAEQAAASVPAQRYGPWTAARVGGGGFAQRIVFCPSDPRRLYTYVDTCGVYRSDDAGRSWRLVSLRMTPAPRDFEVRGVAVDPRNADVVFAAFSKGSGLYRSVDGGATWQQVLAATFHGNDIERWAGPLVAFAPDNPDRMLAASQGDGLFRSEDGGRTWSAIEGGPGRLLFTHLLFDRANPRRAWLCSATGKPRGATEAFTQRGFFLSEDGGASWRRLAEQSPHSILQDPREPKRLHGIFSDYTRIRRSEDGGATWNDASEGLPVGTEGSGEPVNWLSPSRFNTLAAGPDFILCGAANGDLYRRTSDAVRWARVPRESVEQPEDWARGRGDRRASFGHSMGFVGVDPRDPRHWFSTDWYGIWQSRDAGRSWKLTIDGVESTVVHCIAPDPTDPRVVHLGLADNGYFRSGDGGARFLSSPEVELTGNAKSIALGAAHPRRLFMSGGKPVGSWRANQLFVSEDRGGAWRELAMRGLPDPERHDFNLIAAHPVRPDELFVTASGPVAEGGGVYRSTDAGETWSRFGEGLRDTPFGGTIWNSGASLAVSPDDRMLTAGDGRAPWSASDLYRLEGGRWMAVDLDLKGGLAQVAADPLAPGVFYVAANRAGLFRSDDGGLSWKRIRLEASGGRLRVAIDPIRSGRLALATDESVWLSEDGGETWRDLDPERWARDLRPGHLAFAGDRLLFTTSAFGTFWTDLPSAVDVPRKKLALAKSE